MVNRSRREVNRGTHWHPKDVVMGEWTSHCGNHLGQRPNAPHKQAVHMGAIGYDQPSLMQPAGLATQEGKLLRR